MSGDTKKDRLCVAYSKEYARPKLLGTDFYWDGGKMVMTESYHIRRGSCCGSGCLHCPYEPKYVKGCKNLYKR